jgi:hypothetical protein
MGKPDAGVAMPAGRKDIGLEQRSNRADQSLLRFFNGGSIDIATGCWESCYG